MNKKQNNWEAELKRDCKILQKHNRDTDYIIKNTAIPFIYSLLKTQKQKIKKDLLKIANKGELEELRRECEDYFK